MDILDALINGPAKFVPPNPADIQHNALTLGVLSNQQAMGALDVQQRQQLLAMMQDPRYAAAMGSLMNGGSGDGSQPDWAGLFRDYPAAAGSAMNTQLGMVKTMAEVGKTRADADKATTDARKEQMTVLANAADGLAKSEGPLVPDKVLTFLRQAQYVGAAPLMGDIVSAVKSGDEGAVRSALLNFSQAGSSLAQRAGANEQTVRANLAPAEFGLKAYDAARQAAQWVGGGEIKQNAQGGFDVIRPNAGAPMPALPQVVQDTLAKYNVRVVDPQAAPTYSIAPDATMNPAQLAAVAADAAKSGYTPAPGARTLQSTAAPAAPVSAPGNGVPAVSPTGVQATLTPAEEDLRKNVRVPQMLESNKAATVSQGVLQLIPPLRQLLAQGYTGPLNASDVGRNFLATMTQYGLISPADQAKYGSMRAADAISTDLLGSIAHELNPGRGSNMVLQLSQKAKTGPHDPIQASMTLLNALSTQARNAITYNKALNTYIGQNPKDYGLTGWTPPEPSLPPPSGKFADTLPPASVANIGKIATDVDTGLRYKSDGKNWNLVK